MDCFLDKMTLKDSLEFDGELQGLKELIRLKKNRGFRVKWLDDHNFKFVSNISWGTLTINYMPVEGIKGFAKLSQLENGKTKIELKTKIRIELYLFSLFSVVLVGVGTFSEEPWPIWSYPFIFLGLFWFWWVYRIQEIGLFKKLKKYIEIDLKNALESS